MTGVGGIGRGEEGDASGVVRRDGSEGGAEMRMALEIAEELDLVSFVCDGGFVVVCAQVNDFLSAVIAQRGIEEEGAVDTLVGCCVDGGRVHGSVDERGKGWGESWWDRVHAGFGEEG